VSSGESLISGPSCSTSYEEETLEVPISKNVLYFKLDAYFVIRSIHAEIMEGRLLSYNILKNKTTNIYKFASKPSY